MEDEIDLRKYVDVLIRQWKWVVGLAVVSAVVALAISVLLPPTYEATALVVVTRPRYQLQFDPRIETVTEPQQQQPYKAFPELALGDELLMQVIAQSGDSLEADDRELTTFRERVDAKAGADPSLVRFVVTGKDAQQTQAIVNAWAELYTANVNELYQQRSSDAAFFEKQGAEARAKLEAAEQVLIEYQASNPINLVNARLSSEQTALANYL
ncbi:MAG TPA: Wzz/FepE/Etk N-terminal domain-containing protein, partial [Anaerolineae bacterium]|nr:Wzz/FepE/Etk N-terminal domain-containing protein [Anaerolineae bacterium]